MVKSGTYVENAISTNKSLSIKGAGSETTLINFTSRSYEVDVSMYEKYIFYDPAMSVYANNFMISGFTINSNGGEININGNGTQVTANNIGTTFDVSGSYLFIMGNMFSQINLNANYSKTSSNIITNGATIDGQHTIFSLNNITNSAPSIAMNDSLIYGNMVDQASGEILLLDGNNNVFSHNTIDHLSVGLWVKGLNNTIILNQITHCGIALQPSPNNTYYGNSIANNLWGVDTVGSLLNPEGNTATFYKNNMKDNTYQVSTLFASKPDYFDNGKEGNYWSDYHGKDSNGDGIGDTPYVIDAKRSDRYPLIDPVNISTVPDVMPQWAIAPNVQLTNPTEFTYSNGNVALDFVIDKQPVWIGYSLDGQSNITIAGNTTLTNLSIGKHNITVYSNDLYHDTGKSTTINFTIAEPFQIVTVIAVISIVSVIVGLSIGLLLFRRHRKTLKLNSQTPFHASQFLLLSYYSLYCSLLQTVTLERASVLNLARKRKRN
jgi:hypothetical protein